MFARVARADRVERRLLRSQRKKLIEEMAEIYLDVIEAGGVQSKEVLDASKALMDTVTRAEQIEMLALILRRVGERDRDEALELICALLPYAKPRRNAPRGEMAGVSMFNAVARKSRRRLGP